jgi:hypothetical protein
MNLADVQAAVDKIRAVGEQDDEIAHAEEDALHQAVLKAIADGTADDPVGMAALALTTIEMDFSRWFA